MVSSQIAGVSGTIRAGHTYDAAWPWEPARGPGRLSEVIGSVDLGQQSARPAETAADEALRTARAVADNIARVIHAPRETLEMVVVALLAEGHVIVEDFPGVGKTMLAKTLARSIDCRFSGFSSRRTCCPRTSPA